MNFGFDWLFLVKTKAIDPQIISDISVYSSLLPILAFLILSRNWKDKLKWVCLFLVVASFLTDTISERLSRKSVASGTVIGTSSAGTRAVSIKIDAGTVHEGEMIIAGKCCYGTISRLSGPDNHSLNTASAGQTISVEGFNELPVAGEQFKIFSNIWIINIYFLVEALLIFYLFYYAFRNIRIWRIVPLAAMVLLTLVWITRNFIFHKFYSFDSVTNGLETIIVILFSIAFLYNQLIKPQSFFIYSTPIFWIISAVLIYKAGTFFLFLYFNALENYERETFANLYTINSIFQILKNILLMIAFLIKPGKNNTTNLKPVLNQR